MNLAPFFAVDGVGCMGCWIRAIALVGGLMGLLGSQTALATPDPAKLQPSNKISEPKK